MIVDMIGVKLNGQHCEPRCGSMTQSSLAFVFEYKGPQGALYKVDASLVSSHVARWIERNAPVSESFVPRRLPAPATPLTA